MTPSRTNAFDFAEKHAALFAEARVDQLLVVDAAKPAGVQPARKCHFHFIFAISIRDLRADWFAARKSSSRIVNDPAPADKPA